MDMTFLPEPTLGSACHCSNTERQQGQKEATAHSLWCWRGVCRDDGTVMMMVVMVITTVTMLIMAVKLMVMVKMVVMIV